MLFSAYYVNRSQLGYSIFSIFSSLSLISRFLSMKTFCLLMFYHNAVNWKEYLNSDSGLGVNVG